MTSIVIAYHNEGQDFIDECVRQVKETCDLKQYEIIVVDDGSDKAISLSDALVVRNETKQGVGGAFDIGISHASGSVIIMMGCDIRFDTNTWASGMERMARQHPKSLNCCTCLTLRRNDMSFESARRKPRGYGADILRNHKGTILAAQWARKHVETDSTIPCLMGACYSFMKGWYNYIDGFALYRDKGMLEAYLSLKSWAFGGECRIDNSIEVGHIFRDYDEHGRKVSNEIYNKLVIDYLLFDGKLKDEMAESASLTEARKVFDENIDKINEAKKKYKRKIKVKSEDLIKTLI